MSKKKASSKKKTASSRQKAKDSTETTIDHGGQKDTAGIRTEDMPAKEGSLDVQSTEILDQSTETSIDEKVKAEKLRELISKKPETSAVPAMQSKISVPKKIEILSCEMGYGVFASAKIDDGEIIEEAPIHIVSIRTKDGQENPKVRSLLPIVMPLNCDCEDCIELGRRIVLSSGYIQMYNHSVNPNARILQHKANKRIYVIEALKSINHGEQIFINYGPNYPEQWLRPPGVEQKG